jgi:hypothetical protein
VGKGIMVVLTTVVDMEHQVEALEEQEILAQVLLMEQMEALEQILTLAG